MSDDERLSLTTAVSDEDETGEPRSGSRAAGSGAGAAAAASFNCTGAVRKAGFLSVKKWLLRRRHQVRYSRDLSVGDHPPIDRVGAYTSVPGVSF